MAYDLTDRLDEATKQANNSRAAPPAGAIPPTLGNGLSGQSQVAQNIGFVTGSEAGKAPAPLQKPGFDQRGIVTADSAKSVMAEPMQRSGGIAGTMDLAGANAINQRANDIRQSMIDKQAVNQTAAPLVHPETQRIADSNALLNKWDQQYQNQQAISEMARNPRSAQGISHLIASAGNNETMTRGQDLNFGAAMAQQGITARGQDLNNQQAMSRDQVTMRGQDISGGNDAKRLGIDQSRLGIQRADSARADAKWGIEGGILKGQAADSEMVRSARGELTSAINSGDPAKIEAAKAKAVAAGVKFDKDQSPSSSYTPNQAGMPGGMAVTKNPDGSMVLVPVDRNGVPGKSSMIGGKQQPQAPVPQGHTVIGTSGGKRVFQDASGNRFIEGGN